MCLDHCLEHVEKLLLQHPVSRNLCIHIRYPLDTRKYVYQVYLWQYQVFASQWVIVLKFLLC